LPIEWTSRSWKISSAWGKPGAVILEAEILGKLHLGVWEEDRI